MAETNRPLANRILIGLGLGVVAGIATLLIGKVSPDTLVFMRKVSTNVFDPLGQIFLRMLFFVVIPLVFASLTTGIVQLGRLDRLGPLAGRTFFLFFLNMAIGVGLGLVMMNVVQPGNHLDPAAKTRLLQEFGGAAQKHIATGAANPSMNLATIVEMFMPKNLFGAVVGHNNNVIGDVLPLILFAILVGAVGTQLAADRRAKLQESLELVSDRATRAPLPASAMSHVKSELMARDLLPFLADNRIHVVPPCIVTDDQVRAALAIYDEALAVVAGAL